MIRKDTHIHAMILREDIDSEAFIKKAIAQGLQEIAITDHMPLSVNRAADRIPAGQVREYCAGVRALSEQYADQIRILCGIEIDYHPSVIGEIEAVLAEGDFDLCLGSSHLHAFYQTDDFATMSRQDYAKLMLENTMAAAKTGYFHVIPHVDMYRWVFANPQRFPLRETPDVDQSILPIAQEVLTVLKEKNVALEINPHFAHATDDLNNLYPNAVIMRMALDSGVRFCYGSDAHKADDVGILRDLIVAHPLYGQAFGGDHCETL